jgi:hypothetical protein
MTYPPLPQPTVIDGRRLFTAGDMRTYGQACADAERDRLESADYTKSNKASDSQDIDFLRGMMGMKK